MRRELFESVWGKKFVDGHNLASLQVRLVFGGDREVCGVAWAGLCGLEFDGIRKIPGCERVTYG